MISVYDSKCTDFNNNGLVVLGDCKSAIIPEELNGSYELELEYMLDERGKWKYLIEDNIIKADGQLYRIYFKLTTLTSRKVNARHIFYDQIDNYVEGATVIGTVDDDMAYISSHKQYTDSFITSSDLVGSNTLIIPSGNPVDLIMGTTGLISVLGGELVRDNFDIKLLKNRGSDKGVLISYGKNIQGIEEQIDLDVVATRLKVTGIAVNNSIVKLPEYVDSPYIDNYAHPKIRNVQFTADKMPTKDVSNADLATRIVNYHAAQDANNAGIINNKVVTVNVANCASKNNVTPGEKATLLKMWNDILVERPLCDTRAIEYFISPTADYATLDAIKLAFPDGDGVHVYKALDDGKWYQWFGWEWKATLATFYHKANYDSAYSTIHDYIIPLLANMATTSVINGVNFRNYFKVYYDSRAVLLDAVVQKTVDQLEVAQSKANLDNEN